VLIDLRWSRCGNRHRTKDRAVRSELRGVREVGLRRLTGPVLLRQYDVAVRPVRRAPSLHAPLQHAQLSLLVPPRLDIAPVLLERVERVRQSRTAVIADGSVPAATYSRAVSRCMSAFIAASPIARVCSSLPSASLLERRSLVARGLASASWRDHSPLTSRLLHRLGDRRDHRAHDLDVPVGQAGAVRAVASRTVS